MKKLKERTDAACIKAFVYSKDLMPFMLLLFIGFMFFSGHLHADETPAGTDYLAKVKPGMKSTFGRESTFEWLIYLGEAVMCLYRYVSTQNVAWFVGMPVVMAFTYAFLN